MPDKRLFYDEWQAYSPFVRKLDLVPLGVIEARSRRTTGVT
jgi:hypothetical protein